MTNKIFYSLFGSLQRITVLILAILNPNLAIIYDNVTLPKLPGLEFMSSDKHPEFTFIEAVSKTSSHRHKRQVIAGTIYEWSSRDIPFQIWGGDCKFSI